MLCWRRRPGPITSTKTQARNRAIAVYVLFTLTALALFMTSLEKHVHVLSVEIGGRVASSGLDKAAGYIESELRSYGYAPQRQTFEIDGHTFSNIETEIKGAKHPASILVFGAH